MGGGGGSEKPSSRWVRRGGVGRSGDGCEAESPAPRWICSCAGSAFPCARFLALSRLCVLLVFFSFKDYQSAGEGESSLRRLHGHPFVPTLSKWGPRRRNRLPGGLGVEKLQSLSQLKRERGVGAWRPGLALKWPPRLLQTQRPRLRSRGADSASTLGTPMLDARGADGAAPRPLTPSPLPLCRRSHGDSQPRLYVSMTGSKLATPGPRHLSASAGVRGPSGLNHSLPGLCRPAGGAPGLSPHSPTFQRKAGACGCEGDLGKL